MIDKNAVPEPEIRDPEECWKLLQETAVGRLGVVIDGRPEIFPVNYKVENDTLVFLTGEGTKTDAMKGQAVVVMETDSVSAEFGMAWSVVVKGTAVQAPSTDKDLGSVSRSLFPWQGIGQDQLFRIYPEAVTGRRYTLTPAMMWRTSMNDATRAGME
ncbi:pyridoxamine 5'-phosphate oxidase family protein [Arthrobacter sp. NyZ413]|uniref:pyridoxamine 5'-phosphate oxidase family protein n=1 Tax=Arthrobacter sp. NyZ413 TaxID=3144669 RepID=UPI003BF8CA36